MARGAFWRTASTDVVHSGNYCTFVVLSWGVQGKKPCKFRPFKFQTNGIYFAPPVLPVTSRNTAAQAEETDVQCANAVPSTSGFSIKTNLFTTIQTPQ
jgi:hypothetical protein